MRPIARSVSGELSTHWPRHHGGALGTNAIRLPCRTARETLTRQLQDATTGQPLLADWASVSQNSFMAILCPLYPHPRPTLSSTTAPWHRPEHSAPDTIHSGHCFFLRYGTQYQYRIRTCAMYTVAQEVQWQLLCLCTATSFWTSSPSPSSGTATSGPRADDT